MTSHEKGRPLPKFGEWDVNNPASADGFTVIFAKARDEKKAKGTAPVAPPPPPQDIPPQHEPHHDYNRKVGVFSVCGMGNCIVCPAKEMGE